MEKTPFCWVRKISAELRELDTIPLFGKEFSFDWSRLSSLLSSCFHAEISVKPTHQGWRDPAEMRKEWGANPLTVSFTVAPLNTSLFWTMSRADIDKFTSRMLYEKGKGKTSEIIREGFYQYLLLEALYALQQIDPLGKLTFQLEEETESVEENCFCIDIEIQIDDKTCWGTLAIPAPFRKKWIEHFSAESSQYVSTEMARQIELILGVKAAETSLNQEEWEELEPGDFILLDRGGYDLHKKEALATMILGTTPLFQVKIKQNKMELIDYAFTYEETMEQKKIGSEELLQPIEEEAGSIKDVPLNVTIELARVRMTLDKLMHLSPGNLLELPIHPDQSVSLAINGKKVGKGELVYLGETLGVRILEIGS